MSERGEIFFANGDTKEDGDLIWKTVLAEGRLELTPGPGGTKQRKPLVVVPGRSDDQKIGMTDLMESFERGAFQHVTVPTAHSNKVTENTGFIRHLRLAEENGKHVLQAAFEFTEPDIREKVNNGTIANVSCGILRNYLRPRDGGSFPAVIEHIALTNKPWVDGMTPFTKRFDASEGGEDADGYYFADIPLPTEGDVAKGNMFDYSKRTIEDVNEAGSATLVKWDTAGSMVIRQQKLEDALTEFDNSLLVDFSPGRAVVEKDGVKFIAGYRMKDDGSVELHPEAEWQKLSVVDTELSEGGDNTVELAEENVQLKAQLEAAQALLAASAKTERENEAKGYVKGLADELGLSEAPGFLAAVEKILLADDGEAALHLSDDDGKSVDATATDIVKALVEALPRKEGKILLGQQHVVVPGDKKPENNSDEELPLEDRVKNMIEFLGIDNPKLVLS